VSFTHVHYEMTSALKKMLHSERSPALMQPLAHTAPVYLGIEGGGTRTLVRAESLVSGHFVEGEFGPGNLRLLNDAQLVRLFRSIARSAPPPAAIAIGLAGARTDADRRRIQVAAAKAWPGVPSYATNDLETALSAAEPLSQQPRPLPRRSAGAIRRKVKPPAIFKTPRVLVLSGTGSCCYGQSWDGHETAKVGGWGHVLGDKGSAYEIGLRGLKAIVYYYDRDGEWSILGRRILRALALNEPNDLINWVLNAGKDDVARLALEVFEAWNQRDAIAADILKGAAHSLARDAAACARNLQPRGGLVQFVLAGGVLLKQPRFALLVRRELQKIWPEGLVTPLKRSGVVGAVELAKRYFPPATLARRVTKHAMANSLPSVLRAPSDADASDVTSIAQSTTEQRHPRSMNLDRMSLNAAMKLMLTEDASLPRALLAERPRILRGVQLIVRSFRHGGRLFYVGAGTSGRLGVLDASECPPTFRTEPELVQGIIAGGQRALWSAVEGAEDDPQAGVRAIQFRGVGPKDTVVGIAASGRTPFVWGALREAKQRGSSTILLCFNPNLVIPKSWRPNLIIAPKIGPEILTGSTRLKAGTATKLVLNIFTTLAMVRMGKVISNLMIDVKASNVKLKDRAVRIVRELTGVEYGAARAALTRNDWKIKEACAWIRRKSG
jgi:N-acetylmuramic acid 6-phosphate etherase